MQVGIYVDTTVRWTQSYASCHGHSVGCRFCRTRRATIPVIPGSVIYLKEFKGSSIIIQVCWHVDSSWGWRKVRILSGFILSTHQHARGDLSMHYTLSLLFLSSEEAANTVRTRSMLQHITDVFNRIATFYMSSSLSGAFPAC